MRILVDSDILIEVAYGRDLVIAARWKELSESDNPILYSPVSAAELWAGARPNEHATLTNLFRALICVPIDESIGRKAGEYLQRYRKSHALELGDALIASSALLNGAAVWTRNRKHYPMKDLSLL